MNGNNLILFNNDTAFAASKSCDYTASCDIFDVCSASDGTSKHRRKGKKEWSVSCSYLVTASSGVLDLLSVGNSITLKFGDRNTKRLTGAAIIKTCHITATRGALVQGSFEFVGDGPLSQVT